MKDHLSYSASQRRGIIFLLFIIGLYFLSLFFIKSYDSNLGPIEIIESPFRSNLVVKEFKIQIPILKNPNFWNDSDWTLLGFSEKQVRIINNYKLKLDSFRTKKQLFSCYAFNENHKKMLDTIVEFPKLIGDKINLKSFLFIVSEQQPNYGLNKFFDTIFYYKKEGRFHYYLSNNQKNKNNLKNSNWFSDEFSKTLSLNANLLKRIISNKSFKNKVNAVTHDHFILDINISDTSQWKKLKGIGSRRASQVVKYRDLLGGFVNIEQVKEVYSISDSLYDSFSNYIVINDSSIAKININTSNINQLKNHPYIKWNIANSIVSYRNQHGLYKSLNELKKIHIISDELYIKIVSYLTI